MYKRRNRSRQRLSLLLIFSTLLCSSGCTGSDNNAAISSDASAGEASLWVVTNASTISPLYKLLRSIADSFCSEHEGMTVNIETIPYEDRAEQEAYLEQLRTQILAGKGPDIYVLSSSNPLFTDTTQSMYNGIFYDISEYYDADDNLDKNTLVTAVMDAGVVDGARYVLPLLYNFPVLFANVQKLEAAGLRLDSLGTGLLGLTEVLQVAGSEAVKMELCLPQLCLLNFFSKIVDYKSQEVILPPEELTNFLAEYRELMAALGDMAAGIPNLPGTSGIPYTYVNYSEYINRNTYWATNGSCIYLGSLNHLVQNIALAKASGTDLAVLPVRTSDGSLVACIDYFSAVGANCRNPELAYNFLRELLSQESQWDINTLTGWPVRAEGAWSARHASMLETDTEIADNAVAEAKVRRSTLNAVALTEEDFSVLDEKIDIAVFSQPNTGNLALTIDGTLNPTQNPDAMSVDVDQFAKELLQEIRWRIAEG